jgi:O-antigen/teichoic acid export membrane protein
MAAEATAEVPSRKPKPGLAARARLASPQNLLAMAIRRLGWGVVDQAVSSLTNFAVSIYIVRALGATQFGAFSLAYVTYGFALNASRGLSTDPLMVRFSGVPTRKWRNAVGDCTGTALTVGVLAGICVLAGSLVLTGATRSAFVALGVTLPGLMLQDSWRFSFFAAGRGSHAFLNDSIWGVTLLPALIVLGRTGHANVFTFTLAWGATGGIGALAGIAQARLLPRPGMALKWLRQHGDLGTRYLLEGTSSSVVLQVRGYAIGAILGLASVGYIQAAVTLMGPMTILNLGMGLVTIPEGARVLRRSPHRLPMFCVLVSAGLALAGLAWGAVLLVAVPRGLGGWLLHSAWGPVYPLVLPQVFYLVGGAVGSGAGTGLHALGAARLSLRVTLLGALLSVVGALAGTSMGTTGTLYGMGIAAWVSALLMWLTFRKAYREYDTEAAAAGHAPKPIDGGDRRRKNRRILEVG